MRNARDFELHAEQLARQNYILQEYVIGVPAYIHYFYSPLTGKLEIMSMDRRYETNVDSLGRIPAAAQGDMNIEPSYVVVGNSRSCCASRCLPKHIVWGKTSYA